MSTIRVHKDKGYFLASNEPFNDKRLSWEARGVMGYLLSKPDGWECRSYDLINQTNAGRHVIKRIMSELQEAGYVYRYRKSEGRNTIKWVTEVYETPALNIHLLSKGQISAIEKEGLSKADIYEVESFDDEKPVDIVITDPSNDLPLVNTDKQISANADFSRPISLLSEKEVKELKLPLATWKQYLEDEKTERARKGVIDFLEKKIATGPLLPDTPAAQLLFDKLAVEAEAMGRRPPQKFPNLAVKEKFDIAANNLNGTLESAITKALEAGIMAIPKIVNYISSPKWRDSDGPQTRKRKVVSQAPRTQSQFAPPAGSGQSPETARRLREAFAPKV
jgi:hypothetical protein